MLVQNHVILGALGPSDLKFPWADSGLYCSEAGGRVQQMFCIFSYQENNPVSNLSPVRALGSSKGGLLWEINLDRSIFLKRVSRTAKLCLFLPPFARKDSCLKTLGRRDGLSSKHKKYGAQYRHAQERKSPIASRAEP